MLNWALAGLAAVLWGTAYGWYFMPDLRRWLWRRRNRRKLAEVQRAQAYAAWMRRATPRRGAPPPRPQAAAAQEPQSRPPGVVIPFPGPRRTRPKPDGRTPR